MVGRVAPDFAEYGSQQQLAPTGAAFLFGPDRPGSQPRRSGNWAGRTVAHPSVSGQYPGKRRAFAALIGVKVSTARAYLRGEAQLSAYHAERLAATTSNARTMISNGLIIMDRWGRT
jgi:hypothetical protein